MEKLTQQQEDLLFEMVDRMVRCNQHSFRTFWGDNQISIMFEPTLSEGGECNHDLNLDADEDGNVKAIGYAYFNLEVRGEGDMTGTLSGEAEDRYDYLSRVKILKRLKESKDEDQAGMQYKFNSMTAGFFGISHTARYEDNVQDLLNDGSIEENLQLGGRGSSHRGLYITRRGEMRIRYNNYDLSLDPDPHIAQPSAIKLGSAATLQLPEQDFSFMRNARLREIAARDYSELRVVAGVVAPKSIMLLCGAIMETMLGDAIKHKRRTPKMLTLYNTGSNSPVKKLPMLLRWELDRLIAVAVGYGILDHNSGIDTTAIREYRNLVHPLREYRLGANVDQESANIMLNLLMRVLRQLSQRQQV